MTPRSGNGFTLWQAKVCLPPLVELAISRAGQGRCALFVVSIPSFALASILFTLDSRTVQGCLVGGRVGREPLGERSAVWKMIACRGPRVTDQGGFNFPLLSFLASTWDVPWI